jgi:hypothetical protein
MHALVKVWTQIFCIGIGGIVGALATPQMAVSLGIIRSVRRGFPGDLGPFYLFMISGGVSVRLPDCISDGEL